jgi:Dockerin type I domain
MVLSRKLRAFAKLFAFATALFTTVSVAGAACMFRVNGWEATDEGVLLARYSANVTGPALVASTRYAARDPAAVRAAFDSVRLTFDMNGDGNVNAVDATIVLRYVNGSRGSALTQGLTLSGGSRSTLADIESFIDAGCVASIASRAPIYESLPATVDRSALLAQTNAQGARAYVYIGPLVYGLTQSNLYVNDTPGVFTYRSLDTPSTAAAFEQQLNAQGAERYRFAGVDTSGSYFYRDENSNRTFDYRVLALPSTSSTFLSQANAQGANGYYFFLSYFLEGASYAIYAKESGTSVYAYALEASTDVNATPADFIAQANARGANGFKFRTSYFFSDGSRNVYVKDTSQSATYVWKDNAEVANASTLVSQANAEGLNGYVFFPMGFTNPSVTRVAYFKPNNCAGSVLCSPSGPL